MGLFLTAGRVILWGLSAIGLYETGKNIFGKSDSNNTQTSTPPTAPPQSGLARVIYETGETVKKTGNTILTLAIVAVGLFLFYKLVVKRGV